MKLRQRVEAIWENGGRPRNIADRFLNAALRTASVGYGIGCEVRSLAYSIGVLPSRRVEIPVISIGNLTVGGTGKSPVVIDVAGLLLKAGYHPAIVSRGYRRSAPSEVVVVSDGHGILASAEQGGDEPVMMARNLPGLPVVVGSRRYDAALAAQNRLGADVIVLDDGFQHRALARDCDIVLWDTTRPYESLSLLPRGPMREEIWALRRAHALVFTRCNIGLPIRKILSRIKRFAPGLTIFRCGLAIDTLSAVRSNDILGAKMLAGKRVGAFCGIGNPGSFWRLLESSGGQLVFRQAFPDHHKSAASELDACAEQSKLAGAEWLLMTEKDRENLPSQWKSPMPAFVVRTTIDWGEDAERFRDYLLGHVIL